MYKLFTDKPETFECDIKIEGASLSNSKARLVVETTDYSLLFNGKINSNGKCSIPIKKLKGLIDETSKGDIRLEVIAEDTYFTPWESKFEIEASKKVTVEVKSQASDKQVIKETVQVKNIKNESVSGICIVAVEASIFISSVSSLSENPKGKTFTFVTALVLI